MSAGVCEAIWIGGDNIVELAAPTLIAAATKSGIPVFTNNPDQAFQGALFSLGANYSEVGRRVGLMAGEILKGKAPASIPIENVVPPKLVINRDSLKKLRRPWQFPEQVMAEVHTIIEGGRAVEINLRVVSADAEMEYCPDREHGEPYTEGRREKGLEGRYRACR